MGTLDAKRWQRLRGELGRYLAAVLPDRGPQGRRSWAALYLRGWLLDGRRTRAGAMAQRLQRIDRARHDSAPGWQQLLRHSPGDERPGRDPLARPVGHTGGREGLLLLDDTGFPKQATHAVGVARQYSGTPGQVGHCPIAVTLPFAPKRQVVCWEAERYLPEDSWGHNPQRLQAAGVAARVGDRPKWPRGRTRLERAQAHGFSGVVWTDRAYGDVTALRPALEAAGGRYGVGIAKTLKVMAAAADLGEVPPYPGRGRPPSRPEKVRPGATSASVREWAQGRAGACRPLTGRAGSTGQ